VRYQLTLLSITIRCVTATPAPASAAVSLMINSALFNLRFIVPPRATYRLGIFPSPGRSARPSPTRATGWDEAAMFRSNNYSPTSVRSSLVPLGFQESSPNALLYLVTV
jgi:hypothetical protein